MPRIKFTNRSLSALKPSGKQVDYWDEATPGFGLRVSGGGRKTFIAMFRLRDADKTKCRMTLGRFPGKPLADARNEARNKIRLAEEGGDPRQEQAQQRAAETFGDLVDEYLERHARVFKRSWRKDESILNKHFLPSLKRRKAKDVRKRDIVKVLDRMAEAGTPILANRALEIVRKLYNWALSRDLVEINPCHGLAKPSPEAPRERVLSDDEIKTLWDGLDRATMAEGTKLAIRFILVTGVRKGEAAGAAWNEISEQDRLWTIPSERMKNKREHVVPLSPLALRILEDIRGAADGSDWLFPSPRGKGVKPITGPAIDHALRDNLAGISSERINVKTPIEFADVVPHDLRRTSATGLRRLGVSRFFVERVLGHVDPSVAGRHYDKYDNLPEKRAALDIWSDHLLAVLEGRAMSVIAMPEAKDRVRRG